VSLRLGTRRDSAEGCWVIRSGADGRLALSYNLLRDQSIVDSFSRLSRLRYLNLKGNRFTEFPPAVSMLSNHDSGP